MSLLTNSEIAAAYYEGTTQALREQDKTLAFNFARAIESAVTKALAQGVSVEPDTSTDYHIDGYGQRAYTVEAFNTAIAAARVAALEEAAKVCEAQNPTGSINQEWMMERCSGAIRALIGAKTCTSDEWLSNCPQSVRDLANKIKGEKE